MQPARASAKTITDLILRYRSGDASAGEELLVTFRPLIGKYLNLLLKGAFRETDVDVLKFLRYCRPISHCGNYAVSARMLKQKLNKYDREELEQVCKVALLKTASKFINISGSYKLVLLEFISPLLDMIPTTPLRLSEEEVFGTTTVADTEFDSEWVKGVTAGEGFNLLTPRQRELVILIWHKRLSDSRIRAKLKIPRRVLEAEKEEIKRILRAALNIHGYEDKGV